MPESEAWALATQQAHSVGKSPKGYGTAEGRREAKAKYDTPRDDTKTADPGGLSKEALAAFSDELVKIATVGLTTAPPQQVADIKSTPAPTKPLAGTGKYSKVNSIVQPPAPQAAAIQHVEPPAARPTGA